MFNKKLCLMKNKYWLSFCIEMVLSGYALIKHKYFVR